MAGTDNRKVRRNEPGKEGKERRRQQEASGAGGGEGQDRRRGRGGGSPALGSRFESHARKLQRPSWGPSRGPGWSRDPRAAGKRGGARAAGRERGAGPGSPGSRGSAPAGRARAGSLMVLCDTKG